MAILPLVLSPDPRLKKKSAPVLVVDDAVRKLMDDMLETMYHSQGLGLAAVQVGVLKQVIVIDVKQRENEDNQRGVPLFIANPQILSSSPEECPYNEGCLSFPDSYSEVIRPAKVHVRYLDYQGKTQELHAEGLLATCIQHEIDHVNGITFVDHISTLKRDIILRKMRKFKRMESA
jgi:peptide deformylase